MEGVKQQTFTFFIAVDAVKSNNKVLVDSEFGEGLLPGL